MGPETLLGGDVQLYAGYRLDDGIFWAFPLVALLICVIHAARRAFRHPSPTLGTPEADTPEKGMETDPHGPMEGGVRRVMVRYTVPQRLFHWLNAGACLGLLISGLAIYSPGLLPGPIPAASWFAWHGGLAVILLVGMVFHVVYDVYILDSMGFMMFDREARQTFGQIARSFVGLSGDYPRYAKYNPLQLGAHWMIAATLLALVVTGLILWKPTRILLPAGLLGMSWDFIFFCRTLHSFFAAALLALIIGHVYFAIVIRKNWAISKAMLTGRIDLEHYLCFHQVKGTLVRVDRTGGDREHR